MKLGRTFWGVNSNRSGSWTEFTGDRQEEMSRMISRFLSYSGGWMGVPFRAGAMPEETQTLRERSGVLLGTGWVRGVEKEIMFEQCNLQMWYHVNTSNIHAKGKSVITLCEKEHGVCLWMCTNICLHMHTRGNMQSDSPRHWRGARDRWEGIFMFYTLLVIPFEYVAMRV